MDASGTPGDGAVKGIRKLPIWEWFVVIILGVCLGWITMNIFVATVGQGLFIAVGFFALIVLVLATIFFIFIIGFIARYITGYGEGLFYVIVVLLVGYVAYGLFQISAPGPMYPATLVFSGNTYHVGDYLDLTLQPVAGASYSHPVILTLYLKKPDGSVISSPLGPWGSLKNGGPEEEYIPLFSNDANTPSQCYINLWLRISCTPQPIEEPVYLNASTTGGPSQFYFDEPGTWEVYTSSANVASETIQVAPTSEPVLFSVNPTSGPIGQTVTIKGSGFSASGNQVLFSGAGFEAEAADVPSSDGMTLTFSIPQSWVQGSGFEYYSGVLPQRYDVGVSNENGSTTQYAQFTVTPH